VKSIHVCKGTFYISKIVFVLSFNLTQVLRDFISSGIDLRVCTNLLSCVVFVLRRYLSKRPSVYFRSSMFL